MSEKMLIPLSIIIAGVIIGGAIVFTSRSQPVIVEQPVAEQNQQDQQNAANPDIKKVDASDHVYGSRDADLFVVEYSDIECPFCKRYHDQVLQRLKADYAGNARIAFVFRHFPLDAPFTREIHPTATEEAIASECVADIAGNDAFFTYTSALFADTTLSSKSGDSLRDALALIAVSNGVDNDAFVNCYNKQDMTAVAADFTDGEQGGVQGTPTVFMQQRDGTTFLAVADYNVLKQAIDVFLADN